ncbi:MAG: response regulator transcription factor [Propionibacteriaceae bacterium]|jgi:DNA-binding response OmpR family regulator|nr:response regulator transcription factor [Propionibacteriaceae bacterium]
MGNDARVEDRRILLLEDDKQLRSSMHKSLADEGFKFVTLAGTCSEAFSEIFSDLPPELLLLGASLPDGDGISLLKRIRRSSEVPTIMVSHRDDLFSKDEAFSAHADDYLSKSVHPIELIHRVRAVLRRSYPSSQATRCGQAVIDFDQGTITRGEQAFALSGTEFEILKCLSDNRNRVVSHETLCNHVWGGGASFRDALMSHIHRIRTKLEDSPNQPQALLTIRGLGYKLVVE